MKPITEKMTKPAKILVEQLRMDTIRTSLQHLTRINETVIKGFWLLTTRRRGRLKRWCLDVCEWSVRIDCSMAEVFKERVSSIEQVSQGIKLTVLMIVIT